MGKDLLEELNEEQRKAVTHGNGPLMIVAGAGTGKTTVVTHRLAWLIQEKIAEPEQLLALTFTEKAASEMEERVDNLLPYGYSDLQISTFHAFCERFLREYGVEMGLTPEFKVLPELDSWLLTRQNLERLPLNLYKPLGNPTKYLKALLGHISRVKDAGIMPEDYIKFAEKKIAAAKKSSEEDDVEEADRIMELAQVYKTYQDILLEHDSLDFGDLLLMSVQLLKRRVRVRKAVRERFRYILVDEFQDTNLVQYELVKLLAAPDNNLTVVGDDDQSIYAFRGASVENILQFERDFPEAAHVVLTRNYRSVQTILDAAHGFIQGNNPHRLEATNTALNKRLVAHAEGAGVMEHLHFGTLEEETRGVADMLLEVHNTEPDIKWSDCAILVRSNSAAVPFLGELDRRGIPYQFFAMQGLYGKSVILDVISALKVINNQHESPSFYRLLTHAVLGVSNRDLTEILHASKKRGKSLYEICAESHEVEKLSPEGVSKLIILLGLIDRLQQESRRRKVSEIFVMVCREAGIVVQINSKGEAEKRDDFQYLQQFYERIKDFENRSEHPHLPDFLAEFTHERDAGEEGALKAHVDDIGPDMVRVMTVHASKGLEFRYVFVVNVIDGRFPSQARSEALPLPDGLVEAFNRGKEWHVQEERRLMYVAITRAKEGLFFSTADDYGGARKRKPSRFLLELGYDPTRGASARGETVFTDTKEEEEKQERTLIHVPKRFSFTQLTAFNTCPLQYKYAHVLGVPTFGKWSLSYGKTMHNTLHRFFLLWKERQAKAYKKGTIPVSMEEMLELYETSWLDDWYENDLQRERYRAQGEASLRLMHADSVLKKPNIHELEIPFTMKIGDAVLKGRIDRLDLVDGGVEIVDYKTGKPKTIKSLERSNKEQLWIYQLATRDILNLDPIKLTYFYLDNATSISFLGKDKDLLTLQDAILDRVEKIRNSHFLATPGFHCKFCDFSDICEFKDE